MDLVVGGKAYVRGRLVDCEVGIEAGKIVRVAKSVPAAGGRFLRARGLVLPGAIDAHVHLREPGLEHKETIATGTLAALHGGATTVLEMPNTTPAVTSPHTFEDKRARFQAAARVDWGLFAMVDADLRSFELGARPVGYKAYLGGSTHAPGLALGSLRAAAQRAAKQGRPLVVHAEHPDHVAAPAKDDWQAHGSARPPAAEAEAIAALAKLVPEDARVLIAHCTTARGLQAAKRAGFRVEASPHHLLLDDRALRDLGPGAKVNPPLRGPKERAALWKAFVAGKVDVLASDHAPHTRADKAQGFVEAPSGMPGVETMLPLMLAKVRARALGLGTLLHATGSGPADFFGLPKGRIAEGLDADLVVVDLKSVEAVRAERLHSKCGWTAFEGHQAVFPHTVLVRGQLALDEGKVVDTRGAEVRPA